MAQNRLVRASRRSPMPTLRPRPRARNAGFSIALLALPDVAISTLTGIYEVMRVPTSMETGAPHPTFSIELVGEDAGPLQLAGGVPIAVQNSIDNIHPCDIVIRSEEQTTELQS